jgi:DNA polymerase-3 subunit epsilon
VPEETEKVLRWLETPGVRLVSVEGEWSCPVGGGGAYRSLMSASFGGTRAAQARC